MFLDNYSNRRQFIASAFIFFTQPNNRKSTTQLIGYKYITSNTNYHSAFCVLKAPTWQLMPHADQADLAVWPSAAIWAMRPAIGHLGLSARKPR